MSDEERKPRIIVRDRRPFAPDGARRPGVEPRTETAAPVAAPPAGRGAKSARGGAPPAGNAAGGKPAAGPAGKDAGAAVRDDPRFHQLIQVLFNQAVLLLEQTARSANRAAGTPGGRPDPAEEAQRAEALQGVQTVIGLFELLEEKTRGRLGSGDSQLLSQALYQLRLAYMERTKAPRA